MDKNTEIEIGEIIASTEELVLAAAEKEEIFLRLEYSLGGIVEKIRTLVGSDSSNTIAPANVSEEGRILLLWQPRDRDSEIELYLADHFRGDLA